MKKNYISPDTFFVTVRSQALMAASGVNGTDAGKDIGYGGVDEDGDKEPSARRRNIWDDEEEETR